MNASYKKAFITLFAIMVLTSKMTNVYCFHFGLDADIDIDKEIQEFERGVKKINEQLDHNFKAFLGPVIDSTDDKKMEQNVSPSLEQFWQKSSNWVRQLAKKLDTLADSMVTTQPKKSTITQRSYFDSISSFGKKALQQIYETEKYLSSLRKEMEHQMTYVKKVRTYDIKEEHEGGAYQIRITLPDFKQENVQVTIDENQRSNYKKLLVTASKEEFSTWKSESFSSVRYINGRKLSLEYKDGKLSVEIDLPENIKDADYSMHLDKEELIVMFPKTKEKAAYNTRQLRFGGQKK